MVGFTALESESYAFLTQNQIPNVRIGIDLGGDGLTANEGRADPDAEHNDFLNFPVVNLASRADGVLTLDGHLTAAVPALAPYRIEAFSSSRCTLGTGGWPQGHAERYLGSFSFQPLLDVDFAFSLEGVPAEHRYLALTASVPDPGITSELSRCVGIGGADEVASADVPSDATGSVLDDQGVAVSLAPASAAAAMTAAGATGGGRLFVTRYEYAPEVNVFADATAPGVGGTAVRPEAVGARYWYLADRNLTLVGGADAPRTFAVCLDPTNVVRPLALRTVVVVQRNEATGGVWTPLPTTRSVREDGVYLCTEGLTSLGELAPGGAPAAFASGPPDECTPAPSGMEGGQCACALLPPLACDTLPKAIARPVEAACGKLAQAATEEKAKKLKRLLRAAGKSFKKAGKKLAGTREGPCPASARRSSAPSSSRHGGRSPRGRRTLRLSRENAASSRPATPWPLVPIVQTESRECAATGASRVAGPRAPRHAARSYAGVAP